MSSENEKMVIAVPQSIHLGYVKENFGAGTIIELDRENKQLIIDGRKFDETRDWDILQRQASQAEARNQKPWAVPYSDEALEEQTASAQAFADHRDSRTPKSQYEHMKVVESDRDDLPDIDIKHTRAASKDVKDPNAPLPVIKGDEPAESRILESSEGVARGIPVVADDSLGCEGGSKASAMNAGHHIKPREEIESVDTESIVSARKAEIASNRKAAGIPVEDEAEETEEETEEVVAEESEEETEEVVAEESEEAEEDVEQEVALDSVGDIDALADTVEFVDSDDSDDIERVPVLEDL